VNFDPVAVSSKFELLALKHFILKRLPENSKGQN